MNHQQLIPIAIVWGSVIVGLAIAVGGVALARTRYRRWRERTHGPCDARALDLTNQLSETKHELATTQRDYLNGLTRRSP